MIGKDGYVEYKKHPTTELRLEIGNTGRTKTDIETPSNSRTIYTNDDTYEDMNNEKEPSNDFLSTEHTLSEIPDHIKDIYYTPPDIDCQGAVYESIPENDARREKGKEKTNDEYSYAYAYLPNQNPQNIALENCIAGKSISAEYVNSHVKRY